MTTIKDALVAMGVSASDLRDTDEYFEIVKSLVVGKPGTIVKDQATVINPTNTLQVGDAIQVRRMIGLLSDQVPGALASAVNADGPVLYLPSSVTFDGIQQKQKITNLNFLSSFSLEGWMNCTGPGSVGSTSYSTIFGYDGTHRILYRNDNGQLLAQIGSGGSQASIVTPIGSVALRARAHVVFTWEASTKTARLYCNGAIGASRVLTFNSVWSADFWIGAYTDPSGNYSFKGTIDNCAFYNKTLAAARITAHYNAGRV